MTELLRILGKILRRRRTRRITVLVGIVYLLLYTLATGDLSLHPSGGGYSDFYWVDDAWERMVQRRSAWYFEAVAVLSLPYLSWLLAPVNLLIGGVLGALVGLNAAMGYLAWRQPRVCRVGGGGLLGALPGLLAGSACCAPTLVLALGLPASGLLLSLFAWMVPLALVLLVLSMVLLGRRLDVDIVAPS